MTTARHNPESLRPWWGTASPVIRGDGGPAGAASLNEPKGLCVDREGNLYIADSENHVVRRVDRATGIITTVAGVGPADTTGTVTSQVPVAAQAEEDDDPFADTSTDSTKAYTQVTDLSGTVRYVTGGRLTIEH